MRFCHMPVVPQSLLLSASHSVLVTLVAPVPGKNLAFLLPT